MAGASDAIKPERFAGANFRRWQTRVNFWLISMGLWTVVGNPLSDAIHGWADRDFSRWEWYNIRMYINMYFIRELIRKIFKKTHYKML